MMPRNGSCSGSSSGLPGAQPMPAVQATSTVSDRPSSGADGGHASARLPEDRRSSTDLEAASAKSMGNAAASPAGSSQAASQPVCPPPQKTMTRIAHLVGPGVLRVRNNMPAWEPLQGAPLLLHPERLEAIVLHGHADLTGAALRLLWRHGVQVSFVDRRRHRLQAQLLPPSDHAPSLACWQHWAVADSGFRLAQSRRLVRLKVLSLLSAFREYASRLPDQFRSLPQLFQQDLQRIDAADSIDSLRGYEGAASARWHAALRHLFPSEMPYPGRQHHPPPDPVNALLSLGYTLLLSRAQGIVAAVGLDPLVGFYHQPRSAVPALACDLIEPFRAPVVDLLVLAEVRKGAFRSQHFQMTPQGVRLQTEHFRRFLQLFENRLLATPKKCPFERQLHQAAEQLASDIRTWAKSHSPFEVPLQP